MTDEVEQLFIYFLDLWMNSLVRSCPNVLYISVMLV